MSATYAAPYLPSDVAKQVNDLAANINLVCDAITSHKLELALLEKERDRLLLEWWRLDQQHLPRTEPAKAKPRRALTHDEILEQARLKFEAKEQRSWEKAVKASKDEPAEHAAARVNILKGLFG